MFETIENEELLMVKTKLAELEELHISEAAQIDEQEEVRGLNITIVVGSSSTSSGSSKSDIVP